MNYDLEGTHDLEGIHEGIHDLEGNHKREAEAEEVEDNNSCSNCEKEVGKHFVVHHNLNVHNSSQAEEPLEEEPLKSEAPLEMEDPLEAEELL